MYLNKDKILASLTKEDVISVVTSLGSALPKTNTEGDLIFQSVCHGSDSWKLYYYHEPTNEYKGKVFHCYSKCSDSFNIIELVIRANRAKGRTITWFKALQYIAQKTNKIILGETIEVPKNIINDFEWIDKLKSINKNKKEIPNLTEINENILESFYYAPHTEWLNNNISREALSQYEIGYYGLTNQITIPHRDKNNRLIGIRGRYLDEDDIEAIGKYVPLQIGGKFLSHQLGSNFYGINVTQEKIKKIKKVMIVESEKGCLQNYTYFGDDSFVLATCGSNITLTQQKLLLQYLQCEEIIIAFDREYHEANSFEAEIYYNKLVKKVSNIVPYCKVCFLLDHGDRLKYKDSPTDRGKDILMQLFDEKIVITMDEVNRVLKGCD
jgi:hypothetical protein